MSDSDSKGAAVKFPPPLLFLLCIAGGWLVNYLWPVGVSDSSIVRVTGVAIVFAELLLIVVIGLRFRREKTAIEPWKPTTRLMTSGIYGYSRNPIYVGFCITVIGAGLALNNFWIVISFIPGAILVFYLAIAREEKYLQEKFGEEYLEYQKKVRRWI